MEYTKENIRELAESIYDLDAEVYPLGNVIVTGIGNYTFNHWSDSDTNYANANEIAGHGFKSDCLLYTSRCV